ncbi:hypothetical protein ACFT1A_26105 [Rhodococcus sp. NPDC057135]|uniref:hypothetical protein n=1 Tax=Rhodococcus sp. NPDC057135 TaxID=3346028 RepID=UPI003645D8EA
MTSSHPSTVFEATYRGEPHVGFGRADTSAGLVNLYRSKDGLLAQSIVNTDGSADAIRDIIAAGHNPIVVAGDDPELRLRPPLLTGTNGNALLSGFMGTHKKKWDGKSAPDNGEFTPPKWFFKGFGDWIRLPGDDLNVPAEPLALIEEPEVVLVYINDAEGTPHYAGYTFGNDLCDIGLHRRDPGYNPYCKLCDTVVVPLLFLGEPPTTVNGQVNIVRNGQTAWQGEFNCGTDALYYRVSDMVEHLFSFPALRRPGLVNYVLLGADEASFHDGFSIVDGDRVDIHVRSHDVRFENTVTYAASPALSAASA